MVLLRGVWIGILDKLSGITFSDQCNSFVVLKSGFFMYPYHNSVEA